MLTFATIDEILFQVGKNVFLKTAYDMFSYTLYVVLKQ